MRYCKEPDCNKPLSQYNLTNRCWCHDVEDRKQNQPWDSGTHAANRFNRTEYRWSLTDHTITPLDVRSPLRFGKLT